MVYFRAMQQGGRPPPGDVNADLVTADSLFREVFLPLYRGADLQKARTEDANPAKNPSITSRLEEVADVFAENAPVALGLQLDFSDASVHFLSKALLAARDRLLETGELANVVVHGAAYVGACIVKNHGGEWQVRNPLWESLVRLTSDAGIGDLAVFHWIVKSLGRDVPATLADRYRANVEVPRGRPDELPVIAPVDRRLPPLAKVRYDSFYKYIRAHIPELRDVGEDFPSPERFEELAITSLHFLLVGGGRMLVLWGASKTGLHAIWMTHRGFEKAAFWPCDSFPEPIVRQREGSDKIEVVLAREKAMLAFELLWWGP